MTLTVNGDDLDLDLEPNRTLADMLGKECGLPSTRSDCLDGTCGVCTVLVNGEAIRSCLMLAVQCDGAHVRTVEGLAVDHPLRAAFISEHASRCAVCVPGLVMLAIAAIKHDPGLAREPESLRPLLASNVCPRISHGAVQEAVIRSISPG